MEVKSKMSIWATGFAMFSMFFGAGNVIFPLAIGQTAQNQAFFASLGFTITAVGVPFLGLISSILFNGNYKHFFERIGKVPGFILALFIMVIIGPLGAMPRLITVSHSTVSAFWPGLSLPVFSALSCVVIFLFTFKKNKILDILGYFLTPFLLFTLVIIIVKGLFSPGSIPQTDLKPLPVFFSSMYTGYETMDLLATFFFSAVIMSCLESTEIEHGHTKNFRNTIFMALKACLIGAALLAIVYIGFTYVSAFNSKSLQGLSPDQLIGAVSLHILGPYAGIIAILAVALACLTTAIALAASFSEFLHYDIFQDKLPYIPCLILTLIGTFLVSIFGFTGIAAYIVPILRICYPALIVLCILNIGHKLTHFNMVKIPVLITFVISLIAYLYAG